MANFYNRSLFSLRGHTGYRLSIDPANPTIVYGVSLHINKWELFYTHSTSIHSEVEVELFCYDNGAATGLVLRRAPGKEGDEGVYFIRTRTGRYLSINITTQAVWEAVHTKAWENFVLEPHVCCRTFDLGGSGLKTRTWRLVSSSGQRQEIQHISLSEVNLGKCPANQPIGDWIRLKISSIDIEQEMHWTFAFSLAHCDKLWEDGTDRLGADILSDINGTVQRLANHFRIRDASKISMLHDGEAHLVGSHFYFTIANPHHPASHYWRSPMINNQSKRNDEILKKGKLPAKILSFCCFHDRYACPAQMDKYNKLNNNNCKGSN